jgi:ParB family transcriptional regulator, chromosome partitioning protein
MQSFPAAIANISLDELDWEDDRFVIRSFVSHDCLELSLEQHGVLFPPSVWATEDRKYSIVDGFKRLAWARQKGLDQIPCLVFPSACPYEHLMVMRVEGKRFGPPLNPAEKAQIVSKLAHASAHPLVLDGVLPSLGIPHRAEVLAKWRRLSEAGENLLQAAASEAIAERVALELLDWGEEERAEILALLAELRCSASIQMEIVERVTEIALTRGMRRSAVLNEPELLTVLNDLHRDHRRKTQALRAVLTRWRFPRLGAREERFSRDLNAARLPGRVRIVPPPAFEGESWQLQIMFSSPEDLRKLLEKTSAFAHSEVLSILMKRGDIG